MQKIQYDAELWGRLLWATGGLLEFLESSYLIVIWTFTAEGQPTITTSLPENTVRLTDAQGSTTKLKRVAPDEGIKMLRVRKAASPQENTEKAHLHIKTGRYLKAISACTLQAHEVWVSYQ
eukprot:13356779-Ditylum_brightwellii.AAC.1